ncbi:MAG: hypothetical protein ABI972_27795 [Acidobacteriota bacterium]
MINRLTPLLLSLVLTARLSAELTLFVVEQDLRETAVGARIIMPDVPSGDFADLRLRARNTGSTNEQVNSFFVRGAGFSVLGTPGLPFVLAPGFNMDVRLRFQPTGAGSYSGTLQLNGLQVLVTGKSPEAAAIWAQSGSGWQIVSNVEAVDFGRIQANTASTVMFAFRNPTLVPVGVRSMLLAPGVFELVSAPELPLSIAPGAEFQFAVKFAPVRNGVFRTTLDVDGRVISLVGNAYEPPLPDPVLSFASPVFASGRQQALNIRLKEPGRGNGTMRLTLAFTPQQGSPDDAAIQFIANSSRALSFTVRPGDENLTWNGDPNIIFQTGTTAGLIRFTIAYDTSTQTLDFPIAAAPPRLETARILRTASTLNLTITGFDNARSISTLSFTWYHKDGSVIGGGPLVSQVGSIFANYFRNAAGGSTFSATASFPVSGATENVVGVEIEAANAAGTTRAARVAF